MVNTDLLSIVIFEELIRTKYPEIIDFKVYFKIYSDKFHGFEYFNILLVTDKFLSKDMETHVIDDVRLWIKMIGYEYEYPWDFQLNIKFSINGFFKRKLNEIIRLFE